VLVVAAAGAGSFALLLLGSAVLGAGNIAVFLARYAAAEVSPERSRGRALGGIFFAAAIGSVLGPNLLGPSSAVAGALGLPPLSGLYLVAILCFAVAALILTAASSPRLPGLGGGAALLGPQPHRAAPRQALLAGLKGSGARAALLTLATVNGVMVAIMAIAPIHLVAHDHSLTFVGAIVGFHVAGMFAPSPLSGWLVDRVGSRPVAGIGLLFLLAAALAGVGGDGGAGWMATALTLLGVGWNFGVVGGSALLAASIPASERPQAEGLGEVVMGVAAGAGALLAGVIVTAGGFRALSLIVAAAAAVTMLALIDARRGAGRARRASLTSGD
jgi:MFS family permease